jgi:hypothetical protein
MLLGRAKRILENNLKCYNRETGGGTERIDLTHDRDNWRALVNTVTNLRAPRNPENFLSRTTVGFSKITPFLRVTWLVYSVLCSSLRRVN